MKNPQNVKELLTSNKYQIPLYQRNFSWTYNEISQLIIDILDSINESRESYFIGTIVVNKEKNSDSNTEYFSIIDGQQRLTALTLTTLALQNIYRKNIVKHITEINLKFAARENYNMLMLNYLENKEGKDLPDCELERGYEDIKSALNEQLGSDNYSHIDANSFYNYLLNKVKVFINEMPKSLDVNLYFERFNSRGEQLEYHEIIKTELMQKLISVENNTIESKFAKIWDSCSQFETPCINFFKKKIKSYHVDEEREKVFNCKYTEYQPGNCSWEYGFDLNNIFDKMEINNENKDSLINSIQNNIVNKSITADDDYSYKYRCIINYNTFLLYVLYITDGINSDDYEFQLDDKKLLTKFKSSTRDSEWIKRFASNLLKLKFIFDNLIIRSALETRSNRNEGEWFLQKTYRTDQNSKKGGHLYVQTKYDKNSFKSYNKEILMIQSMFAVTFTAYKDTKWLFNTLKFLFDNVERINSDSFSNEFYIFLENLSRNYAKERLFSNKIFDENKLRYDNNVPIFAFNLTDYILWKNIGNYQKIGLPNNSNSLNTNFENFNFKYRRSIEHWYPQNPSNIDGNESASFNFLHSFGNLCLITASQNSKFSNLVPTAKLDNWINIIHSQSLKLQIMAILTKECEGWDEANYGKKIKKTEKIIINLIIDFIENQE